jgi:hypothetical protein
LGISNITTELEQAFGFKTGPQMNILTVLSNLILDLFGMETSKGPCDLREDIIDLNINKRCITDIQLRRPLTPIQQTIHKAQ